MARSQPTTPRGRAPIIPLPTAPVATPRRVSAPTRVRRGTPKPRARTLSPIEKLQKHDQVRRSIFTEQ